MIGAEADLYSIAEQEELKYYAAVSDCLAQCATAFGGGISAYGGYSLLDLLRWTHRAIVITRGAEDGQ